jgi:hypothetical protein
MRLATQPAKRTKPLTRTEELPSRWFVIGRLPIATPVAGRTRQSAFLTIFIDHFWEITTFNLLAFNLLAFNLLTFNLSSSKHHCPSLLFRQLRSEGTQPLHMAGSSKPKKGATKSPQSPQSLKRKRKGNAAATETKSVDVNDKDYNIRSPERTQLLTQIKGTTKSPKRRRKGNAAAAETKSIDVNDEDYNIRSPERTQLLIQIKGILNNATVSPAFWACCQLADMNRLQRLATYDEDAIVYFQKPLNTLPLQCELLGF